MAAKSQSYVDYLKKLMDQDRSADMRLLRERHWNNHAEHGMSSDFASVLITPVNVPSFMGKAKQLRIKCYSWMSM